MEDQEMIANLVQVYNNPFLFGIKNLCDNLNTEEEEEDESEDSGTESQSQSLSKSSKTEEEKNSISHKSFYQQYQENLFQKLL